MNAAPSSCRTCTKRIRSRRVRSPSMNPLMPSPGRPQMTSTPKRAVVQKARPQWSWPWLLHPEQGDPRQNRRPQIHQWSFMYERVVRRECPIAACMLVPPDLHYLPTGQYMGVPGKANRLPRTGHTSLPPVFTDKKIGTKRNPRWLVLMGRRSMNSSGSDVTIVMITHNRLAEVLHSLEHSAGCRNGPRSWWWTTAPATAPPPRSADNFRESRY